jgi:hypothetical protein
VAVGAARRAQPGVVGAGDEDGVIQDDRTIGR